MDIVGLGTAACNIVEAFSKYPQYTLYKIDTEPREGNFFPIEAKSTPEEAESTVPDMTDFFANLGDEVMFFVVGSGMTSAVSLAILEQAKDKKITLFYIQPKLNNLTGTKKKLEKVAFGVLQQYARSGLIEEMVLVSNQKIANMIGNLPVIGYFTKINEMIASTVHFVNVFERTKHVYGILEEKENVCRISTVGLLDPASSEEKIFYDLDLVREKEYFYALSNDRLLSESNLVAEIEDNMQQKKENSLTKISYRLYSTEYETEFGYCRFRTSKVQGE
jgi:hypothetical protein